MGGEVIFECKRTVVTNRAVQPGTYHNISVLDHIMEPAVLHIVYYYQFPSETSIACVSMGKLQESLAEVLSSFPVATGRLQRTLQDRCWVVKCNDAGVRIVEARMRGSLEDWFQAADGVQELKLTYWDDMYENPYLWSTFYIQITEFERGGLAIGLSCSHMLADAVSATSLVKAWADTHLIGKMLSPPYFHPLPPRRVNSQASDHHFEPCMNLIDHYIGAFEKASVVPLPSSSSESYATITFTFSDDTVRRCISEAGAGGVEPTPFEALAALFWVSISRVKNSKQGLLNMSICLEMRKMLGLSREFFGNAMVFSEVSGKGVDVRMQEAARAVGDVVGKIKYAGVMDLLQWLESNYDGSKHPSLYGPQLMCANWESLGAYDAMFEIGAKPVRVSYYLGRVVGEGQIIIIPSAPGNGSLGRVVMVTLPVEQVLMLCQEALVLKFSPAIVMNSRENSSFELTRKSAVESMKK